MSGNEETSPSGLGEGLKIRGDPLFPEGEADVSQRRRNRKEDAPFKEKRMVGADEQDFRLPPEWLRIPGVVQQDCMFKVQVGLLLCQRGYGYRVERNDSSNMRAFAVCSRTSD